ncbi:MAG: hypothetical protein H6818_05060 [Phycisphaerales bacterium]|nr:hypothetical protein [Phycisphaerales bacterium]MCB9863446.1 hypothetical protein [Phycisphaerales bacterium]
MAPHTSKPKQTPGRVHTDPSRDTHDRERKSPFAQRRGHRPPARRQPWLAPLCVFAHLAWRLMEADPLARRIAWIGSRCTPYPQMLVRSAHGDDRLLARSLFIQAPSRATRLWAADLALRSNAVGAVLVDGSGFDTAATRRLHLLAKTHGKLVLSARPIAERDTLSAAITRWIVRPASVKDAPRHSVRPRWQMSLIRCKTTSANDGDLHWLLEWKHGEGALDLSRPMARPAGATETTAAGTHERQFQQVAFG